MASHGGILGLMIFTLFYCRKMKVSWTGLGDGLCVVAPLGLMFGRTANFINGELYGRVTDVSWGMKFPDAIYNSALEDAEFGKRGEAFRAFVDYDPKLAELMENGRPLVSDRGFMLERLRNDEGLREIAANHLEIRHPSQLYEAFFEGALLFAVLWFLRVKFPKMKHGVLTGLFFVLYAIARIFCEFYRQREEESLELLSRGQFLSLFMIIIGVVFIIVGVKRGGNAPEDRVEFDKRTQK